MEGHGKREELVLGVLLYRREEEDRLHWGVWTGGLYLEVTVLGFQVCAIVVVYGNLMGNTVITQEGIFVLNIQKN